jgi:tetratricopeptide (TPR) repeat protein
MARLRATAGKLSEAVALYDRAASVLPEWESAEPRYAAALLLVREGGDDAARAAGEDRLRGLLRDQPTYGRAAAELARLAFRRGDKGDATLALALRAARFQPDTDTVETLGLIRLSRGEYASAARALRWAVERGAAGGDTRIELGRALAATGDVEAARVAFEDALARVDVAEQARVRGELAKLDQRAKEM